MFKKIRSSLSAKVFLWITGLLALCCVLIYGLVMLFLPESYTVVTTSRVEEDIQQLLKTLSQTEFEDIQGPH